MRRAGCLLLWGTSLDPVFLGPNWSLKASNTVDKIGLIKLEAFLEGKLSIEGVH